MQISGTGATGLFYAPEHLTSCRCRPSRSFRDAGRVLRYLAHELTHWTRIKIAGWTGFRAEGFGDKPMRWKSLSPSWARLFFAPNLELVRRSGTDTRTYIAGMAEGPQG